jgi:RimJ/RimL family protein N-acetyltransferase
MTTLALRPFTAEDAHTVASWFGTREQAMAFAGSEAPWPYTPEALLASVAHPARRAWTVVTDDAPEQVAGHVETVLVTPDSGRLARIALAPSLRGRGLSEPMLALALAEARRVGMRTVALFVVPGNEPALRAYARVGFRPTEPDPDHPEYLRLARDL